MNRYVIIDGLPYLYDKGKAIAVRFDEKGLTIGKEVKFKSVPAVTVSELSVKAKCKNLDSIGKAEKKGKTTKGKDTEAGDTE